MSEFPRALHWRDLAACRGVPVDVFFPERGQQHGPAKEYCDRCEVRAECLADDLAVTRKAEVRLFGVRGGLSARAREPLMDRSA